MEMRSIGLRCRRTEQVLGKPCKSSRTSGRPQFKGSITCGIRWHSPNRARFCISLLVTLVFQQCYLCVNRNLDHIKGRIRFIWHTTIRTIDPLVILWKFHKAHNIIALNIKIMGCNLIVINNTFIQVNLFAIVFYPRDAMRKSGLWYRNVSGCLSPILYLNS